VRLVRAVKKAFFLDEMIIVPSAQPPHKDSSDMAPPEIRLEMTRLAFAGIPGCRVSDIELSRSGPSYTMDTVTALQSRHAGSRFRIYLVLGIDAFLELDTWKDYRSLLAALPFIVVHRPPTAPAAQQAAMKRFLQDKISRRYSFSRRRAAFFHPDSPPVFYFSGVNQFVSATEIRDRIRAGRPVKNLLPAAVARVIQNQGLYQ